MEGALLGLEMTGGGQDTNGRTVELADRLLEHAGGVSLPLYLAGEVVGLCRKNFSGVMQWCEVE